MRRFVLNSGWCAALAVACTFTSVSCAKIASRDLIREGNALYGDGKYAEAIARYDEAETLEPDAVTLFWNRACAAEAQVLRLKKDKDAADQRHRAADIALRDFQTWLDRLDERTEEDTALVQRHRMAILEADERCDDILAYWLDRHRAAPNNEALYGKLGQKYEECGDVAKSDEWFVKRTEDFPDSAKAWYTLGTRKFQPLFADPESGLPYNADLPPAERLKIADEVLSLMDRAAAVDPKFRDAYVWRSMAYNQRSFARQVVENPELPELKLEALLAREDRMLAWKQTRAICDWDALKECPGETPETPCCPPPPLTPEEQASDADLKVQVLEEIRVAEQAAVEAATKRNKRRRR